MVGPDGSGVFVLLVGVVLAAAAVFIAVLFSRRPASSGRVEAQLDQLTGTLSTTLSAAAVDLGQVRQSLGILGQAQGELRTQLGSLRERVEMTTAGLADKTGQVQTALQREITEAKNLVALVRTELGERKSRDDEVAQAVKHLESVLAGAPSKGAAGENILDRAFSSFPPEMIERNFRVRGKVVEYALVLAGSSRRMAIDSKWPATAAIERLATETEPEARQKAVIEVRTEIRRKVREVAQYIDPLTTTDKAIAAIPDAAYPHCHELAFEAYSQGVIIMPYSMIVPYVLNLYNLHLKYSRSVDLDSLDHALAEIERNVDSLDKVLDNSIHRGATMIENAYDEVKQIANQIKRSLVLVRALPAVAEQQALGDGAGPSAGEETPGDREAAATSLFDGERSEEQTT